MSDILLIVGGIFAGGFVTIAVYETYIVPNLHIHYRRRREARLREERSRDLCSD